MKNARSKSYKGKIVSGPYFFDHPLSDEQVEMYHQSFKLIMKSKSTKSRRSFQKAALANFEAASTGLFNEFVRKYYGKNAEWEFVISSREGFDTFIEIADAYISLENAYYIMKLGFTRTQYFDYVHQYTDEGGCPSAYSYYYQKIMK